MYSVIKSANRRAVQTKREWRELKQLADEYGVNICHTGNFLVMREILKHRAPKQTTMIGLLFQWYNQLPDWKKTIVASAIGLVGITLLVIGKQNNIF